MCELRQNGRFVRRRPFQVQGMLPLVVGIVTFCVYMVFPCPAKPGWIDVQAAVAAGLYPPTGILPGFWHRIVGLFPVGIEIFFCAAGALTAAVFAGCVCSTFYKMLVILSRQLAYNAFWHLRVLPALALMGAFAAVFAEPVWSHFSVFAPTSLTLLYFAAACHLYLKWTLFGGWGRLCFLMLLIGLFAAETPLAPLTIVLLLVGHALMRQAIDADHFRPRRGYPRLCQLPFWRLFFSGVVGLAVGVWLNYARFVSQGGPAAIGLDPSRVIFLYGREWLNLLTGAASTEALVLATCICVFPLFICLRAFPATTADPNSPPFHLGVAVAFCGIIAYFQQGQLPVAWFWTWGGGREIAIAPVPLAICSLMASATAVLAFGIFAFDTVYRSDRRTATANTACQVFLVVLAMLAIAATCYRIPHLGVRAVLRLKRAVVRQIVRDCAGIDLLFSDGVLDAAVELEARRTKGHLKVVSLSGGSSPHEKALRMRGLTDGKARIAAAQGADVLMTHVAFHPGAFGEVALLAGAESWLLLGRKLAEPSAFSVRVDGGADASASCGDVAADFARRILALSPAIGASDISPSVRAIFFSIAHCLEGFARLRNDDELADRVGSVDGVMGRVQTDEAYAKVRRQAPIDPRQALEAALNVGNHSLAARYARLVLRDDPDDLRAHFALGMDCFEGGLYPQAELHMRRFLITQPDDSVALNTLSTICLRTRRYDEAVDLARRAVTLLPDDERMRKTLSEALERQKASRELEDD